MLDQSVNPDYVKARIKEQLVKYFADLRRTWSDINRQTGRGYSMTIYRSKILSRVMMIVGVANATLPRLNGKDEELQLVFNNTASQLPILGEVTINE